MNRRSLLSSGLLTLMLAGTAVAQSFQDSVVAQLRAQGFSEINVSRTLLGRAQIEATSATHHREIILNPRTGEILRDFWEALSGTPETTSVIINSDSSGKGSGNSGSGGSDDGDAGDDNSGHGSGSDSSGSGSDSSGSGSGNSGSGSDNSGSGNSGSGNGDDG